jgi:hypothetical protein
VLQARESHVRRQRLEIDLLPPLYDDASSHFPFHLCLLNQISLYLHRILGITCF